MTTTEGASWPQVTVLLWDEYTKTKNAQLLGITNDRMRQWVRRDHVKRTPAGYDTLSLLRYLHRRFGVPLDLEDNGALSSCPSRSSGAEL